MASVSSSSPKLTSDGLRFRLREAAMLCMMRDGEAEAVGDSGEEKGEKGEEGEAGGDGDSEPREPRELRVGDDGPVDVCMK